jgi:hypothetical protein
MANDWALVVGINRYPTAGVSPLEGAVRDAKAFHRWVIDPKGGAVAPHQARLLTSPATTTGGAAGPARPVFSDVMQFFEHMLDQLGNGSGRRLYIYLSGHGISPTGQESARNAALLMANATAPKLWHNFAGNIWAEGARSAARFREVVLIMDCCRDVKTNATVMPHLFGDPTPDSKECRLIEVYATGWDSKARELVFPPAKKPRGVFTRSLLAVLGTGRMSGVLLKESVKQHLALALKDEKKAQVPEIGRDEELAKIVFNEAADPPKTEVIITGHPATPPVIELWPEGAEQSTQAALDGWSHDGAAWTGTLEPGVYELRLPTGGGRRLPIVAGVTKEVVL